MTAVGKATGVAVMCEVGYMDLAVMNARVVATVVSTTLVTTIPASAMLLVVVLTCIACCCEGFRVVCS